jgi:hypothetical protein
VVFVDEFSFDLLFAEIELEVFIFQPQEWYCFSIVQLEIPRIKQIIIDQSLINDVMVTRWNGNIVLELVGL